MLGTIHDPTNAVVTNVAVTLVNVRTGTSTQLVTDANGNYEFVNQRTGAYLVRAAAPGFQSAETQPFDLTVNARQRVDLTLVVGEATRNRSRWKAPRPLWRPTPARAAR